MGVGIFLRKYTTLMRLVTCYLEQTDTQYYKLPAVLLTP